LIVGLIGWIFKFVEHKSFCIYLKCAYSIIMSIGLIIAAQESTFVNGKYIACLTFGYTSFRVWGDKKPTAEIANVWFYIQPFLFGTIGAALLISEIRPRDVGSSFILIFCG
jgi:disulfide bond formation protein DsbB